MRAGTANFDLDEVATVNDLLRAADADIYRRRADASERPRTVHR